MFKFLSGSYSDLVVPSMTFGILILFFLAIIRKN
jgi:hypothetical protein